METCLITIKKGGKNENPEQISKTENQAHGVRVPRPSFLRRYVSSVQAAQEEREGIIK